MKCDHTVWYGRDVGLISEGCKGITEQYLKDLFCLAKDVKNIMKIKGEFFKYCPDCGEKL
jgi:hypothetical protein